MRWPFRRRAAERATPEARRPSRAWAGLPPLRPVGLRPDPEVASAARFQAGLSTRWQQAPILAPLAHGLTLSAPAGLTSGVVTPVTGYADAPELRWQEPSALPQLPVVGEAAPKPLQALISHDSQPVTAIRSASRLAVPAADPEPSSLRPLTPPVDEPPVAEKPAEPPPPPVEPAPRARRLGRLGPPLNIDAVPPAVLRPEPALVEPNLAPPPVELPPLPEAPVAAPVIPLGLGVPDWFATPSTDPDEPVAARWVAPLERQDFPTPDAAPPFVAEDRRRAEPTTGPPARPDVAEPAAELPFRPFRRFGPGAQPSEPVSERLAAVPDEAVPAVDVEPARVVDEPPRAAQPIAEAPAEPLPVVAARPVPQPELPERPLASVRRSLSFLPNEGVALLPGLARQPDPVSPAPRAAEPMAEPQTDEWLPIPDFAALAAAPPAREASGDPFAAMPGATAMPAWPAELGPQPDWYSPPSAPAAVADPGPAARPSYNAMPDLPARPGFHTATPTPGLVRGPMPGHTAMPGTPDLPGYPATPGFPPFTESAAMPPPSAMLPPLPDGTRLPAMPGFEPKSPPAMPGFAQPQYAPLDALAAAVTSDVPPADAPPRRRIGHIGPPVAEPRAEPPPARDRDWPDHAPLPHPVPMPGLPAPHHPAAPLAHSQAGEDDDLDPDDDAPPDGERLDNLAGELYDRIRDRLRRELLVDRERAVMLTDWR